MTPFTSNLSLSVCGQSDVVSDVTSLSLQERLGVADDDSVYGKGKVSGRGDISTQRLPTFFVFLSLQIKSTSFSRQRVSASASLWCLQDSVTAD